MQIIDRVIPQLYKTIKQNPLLRNLAMSVWQLLRNLTIWYRHSIDPVASLPAPTKICSSTKVWVANYSALDEQKTVNYQLIYPSHTITRKLPKTIDRDLHWKFGENQHRQIPDAFVITIPNGRVWNDGKIITPDNQLLADLSTQKRSNSGKLQFSLPKKMPPVDRVSGVVVSLSCSRGTGYYHWLCDILSRLALLQKAGISFQDVDRFLIDRYVSPFQIETLNILGIPRSKVIENHWYPHIQADRLIVPSLLEKIDHSPQWVCDFLKQSFLSKPKERLKQKVRLYINRSQVVHRRVENEPEIIQLLSSFGFLNITLESLSIKEQALLLHSAEIVISPHGAGLTNLVFCQPGTKVIELLSPRSVVLLFWALSSQIGLDYYYLLGEGEIPPKFIDPFDNNDNIIVNLDSLSQILRLAGIE